MITQSGPVQSIEFVGDKEATISVASQSTTATQKTLGKKLFSEIKKLKVGVWVVLKSELEATKTGSSWFVQEASIDWKFQINTSK